MGKSEVEKNETDRVRIDKWLWAVRLYKTRAIATQACDQGKIIINDMPAKASRIVHQNDIVKIKRTGIVRIYKVLKVISNRIGAKLVVEHCEDLTSPSELQAYLTRTKSFTIFRDPGTGRPTKRERRDLDDFFDEA